MDTVESICDEVGVPVEAKQYIIARGFHKPTIFAHAAVDEAAFRANVVQPFLDGFTVAEVKHQCTGDVLFTAASMVLAWEEAKCAAIKQRPELPMVVSQGGSSGVSAGLVDVTKPPKALKPGDWRKQVDAYENKWVPKRVFPQHILLGPKKFWPGCCGS